MNKVVIIRVPETYRYKELGYSVFRIDRKTPVGNPYRMHDKSLAERDRVCDLYYHYFYCTLTEGTHTTFINYLHEMLKAHKQGKVALACWCVPLRCHGETIKEFIEHSDEQKANKDFN